MFLLFWIMIFLNPSLPLIFNSGTVYSYVNLFTPVGIFLILVVFSDSFRNLLLHSFLDIFRLNISDSYLMPYGISIFYSVIFLLRLVFGEESNVIRDALLIFQYYSLSFVIFYYFSKKYVWSEFRNSVILGCIILVLITLFETGFRINARLGDNAFLHPNTLGSILCFPLLMMIFERNFKYRLPVLIFFASALILTFSKTTILSLILTVALIYIINIKRNESWLNMIYTFGLFIGVYALFSSFINNSYAAYTSDDRNIDTLSGRTDLWSLVIELWSEKPWYGYGYGSFKEVVDPYKTQIGFEVEALAHAHNAYLTSLLETGLVGVVVFVFLVLSGVIFAVRRGRNGAATNNFAMSIVILEFLRSFTEGALYRGIDNIFFITALSIIVVTRNNK